MWFLLPGDGASAAYLLVPSGKASSGVYPYQVSVLGSYPAQTVGQPAIMELTDASIDLLIPNYEAGIIHVHLSLHYASHSKGEEEENFLFVFSLSRCFLP